MDNSFCPIFPFFFPISLRLCASLSPETKTSWCTWSLSKVLPSCCPGQVGKRMEQDGAGTYLIWSPHLAQGLRQSGPIDKALVAGVITGFPAPGQTVLCTPSFPPFSRSIFRQAVLSLMFIIIIISVLAIINIYYWLVMGIASVCLVPCAKLTDLIRRP